VPERDEPGPGADDQLARARAALAAARAALGSQPGVGRRRAGLPGASQPGAAQRASDHGGAAGVSGESQPGESQPGESQPPGPGQPGLGQPGQADPGQAGPGPSGAGQASPGRPGRGRLASPRAARRERREDPQALSAAIDGLLDAEGWNQAAATGSVFGRWAQIVGADLAGHTQPESLRDGELIVQADSTAWATQLRLLQAQLIRRLNAELGAETVLRVKVRGPVTATRKPGEWRVRGSRGPRDTYG
jgi:predicted nucleic acid-binding Zn ribbon protein